MEILIPHSTFYSENQTGEYLGYKEEQSSSTNQINPQLLTEKTVPLGDYFLLTVAVSRTQLPTGHFWKISFSYYRCAGQL